MEVFKKQLDQLYKSGDYSDMTIRCADASWNVHRAIVCTRSKFFKKACQPGFKEGETSTVELKDVDPLLIDQLISYFYTFQYSVKDREHQPLALNVEMYIIGDRYQLSGLKVLAKSKFSAALLHCWDKEPLTEIIRNIYENTVPTDRGLRDALLPILQEHRQTLRVNEEFKQLVRTLGDFAVDLMHAWGAPAPAVVAVPPAKKRAKIETPDWT